MKYSIYDEFLLDDFFVDENLLRHHMLKDLTAKAVILFQVREEHALAR